MKEKIKWTWTSKREKSRLLESKHWCDGCLKSFYLGEKNNYKRRKTNTKKNMEGNSSLKNTSLSVSSTICCWLPRLAGVLYNLAAYTPCLWQPQGLRYHTRHNGLMLWAEPSRLIGDCASITHLSLLYLFIYFPEHISWVFLAVTAGSSYKI